MLLDMIGAMGHVSLSGALTEPLEETLGNLAEQTGLSDLLGGITLRTVLFTAALVVVCVAAVKILLRLLDRFLASGTVEPSLHAFIRTTAKILLWFVAGVIILGSLGIEITSLVAVLSVAGLAVSLAVQGALSNLAGGVQILSAKPFKVGDYISASSVEGTVLEINMVHTKIQTVDNKLIYVPNSELSAAKVINFTAEPTRRVDLVFSTSYDDPTEKVVRCIRGVIEEHPAIHSDPEPFVRLSAFQESCIDYTVRVWCDTADYWDVHFDLLEQVRAAFEREGIEMTYNHLNVHMVAEDTE